MGTRPVQIRASGEVVDSRGTVVGQLQVVRFGAPEVLVKEGQNLLLAPPNEAPVPVESVTLLEGSVERSNVQAVSELANLVILQRAFDAVMRVLQSDDEATQALIREMSS